GADGRSHGTAELPRPGRRRVVYPVPGSDQLSWQTVHVGPAETGATCLTNEAASDITAPVFKPCVLTGADTIDGHRNGVVRLELP
ncbi:MAG TPA: hypothetical protein VHN80_05375, partial [Kineosporiaceae bacterium]|nr:hypothetical protein [Kineosporiaceae bacterium]